ncbi:MAG: hypothetical protein AAF242_01745 [Bacteroidota bacterium]
MSKFKLDFKSLLIGMLCSVVIFQAYSFNQPAEVNQQQNNLYQAAASENGFIILNTATGKYIIDSDVNYIGKMRWIKGDFDSSFDLGIDKTKK